MNAEQLADWLESMDIAYDKQAAAMLRIEQLEREQLALAELLSAAVQKGKGLERENAELRKDAERYRWMQANYKLWSWKPTRYNSDTTSGFAFNGTGYLGYSFEDALTLAMKELK